MLNDALQHTPADTEVTVAVEIISGNAQLTVTDEGPGMTTEQPRTSETGQRVDLDGIWDEQSLSRAGWLAGCAPIAPRNSEQQQIGNRAGYPDRGEADCLAGQAGRLPGQRR